MYSFLPYGTAGIADLVSFIQHGNRSTHLSSDHSIFGFGFNFSFPLELGLADDLAKTFPDLYLQGKEMVKAIKEGSLTLAQALEKMEATFGKSLNIAADLPKLRKVDEATRVQTVADLRAKAGKLPPVVVAAKPRE